MSTCTEGGERGVDLLLIVAALQRRLEAAPPLARLATPQGGARH